MSKFVLTFSNIVGDFTVDKELIGKQDPYIIFSAGAAKSQTKALKGIGANIAKWTESYTLPDFAPSKATVLHVDVYNHNTLLPDNLIGSGTIDLATLSEKQLAGSGESVHVLLTDKKGKSTGVLKFVLNGGGYFNASATGAVAAGARTAAGYGAAQTQESTRGGRATAGEKVQTATAKPVAATAATGTAATGTAATGTATAATGAEVDRKYFTEHEDRAEEQVLVEKFKEHRPYVQEYETVVQPTGRVREVGGHVESLGSEVRTVGSEVRQEKVDIERHLPEGAVGQRPGGEGWVQGKPGPVVDSATFEVGGERVVDKERLTQLREHRDVEKEFEVRTNVQQREIPQAAKTEVVDRHRVRAGETGAGTASSNVSTAGTTSSSSTHSSRATHQTSQQQQSASAYNTYGQQRA
jgi:hypothetical protein